MLISKLDLAISLLLYIFRDKEEKLKFVVVLFLLRIDILQEELC